MRIFQAEGYIAIDFDKRRTRMIAKKSAGPFVGFSDVDPQEESYEEVDELEHEIGAFITAARDGTPPAVGGVEGLRALKAAFAITDSLKANWDLVEKADKSFRQA